MNEMYSTKRYRLVDGLNQASCIAFVRRISAHIVLESGNRTSPYTATKHQH